TFKRFGGRHLHEKFSNSEIRDLTKEIEKIEEELKEARQNSQ
ncbi:41207_t:CDS:1, partial [Gigaspora margarita]